MALLLAAKHRDPSDPERRGKPVEPGLEEQASSSDLAHVRGPSICLRRGGHQETRSRVAGLQKSWLPSSRPLMCRGPWQFLTSSLPSYRSPRCHSQSGLLHMESHPDSPNVTSTICLLCGGNTPKLLCGMWLPGGLGIRHCVSGCDSPYRSPVVAKWPFPKKLFSCLDCDFPPETSTEVRRSPTTAISVGRPADGCP